MANNQQPNKGVLFTNSYKKAPSQPDWRGEYILDDGTVIKLSGWSKSTPKGDLISLALDNYKPKNQNNTQYPKDVTPEDEGDLPF